jgi:hypothetical protein
VGARRGPGARADVQRADAARAGEVARPVALGPGVAAALGRDLHTVGA